MLPTETSERNTSRGADPSPSSPYWRANVRRIALLLLIWAAVTVVPVFLARDYWRHEIFGWPAAYWMAAFGAPLSYLIIIGVYAWLSNRADARQGQEG
ncbi:DUF4212 domain-containing protein [Bordetella trematum]|uniref:DUF4212 domain-containing protein n=1 Tax=Bordetella trematum TaxID=123899 RepID=UPI003AF388B8